MNVINFDYEGNEIPFRVDENGEVFMNATKMAEPFKGKRVNNFLRGKDLLEYINALHESKSITQIRVIAESPLIQVVRGRSEDAGTWFQEDLALRYSQWINPKFRVWCNQRIKEILNQGFSALTQEATEYIEDEIGEEVRLLNTVVKPVQGRAKRI